MELLICILIVYGCTFLCVQGKIFSTFKIFLSNIRLNIENKITMDSRYIKMLIDSKSYLIDDANTKLYNHILNKLYNETNDKTINELGTLLIELENKIKSIILNKYKYKLLLYKGLYSILNKFLELTSCMMCLGFWIGVIFTLINLFLNISICNYSLNLIPIGQTGISTSMTIIFLSYLYSGTCWIINSFVDFFVEIKDKLGSFLDKQQN